MERLLADAEDESSSNEIALRLRRERRKTGRFLYAIYSICGVARGQTAQNEFHSEKDSLQACPAQGGHDGV